MSNKSAIFLDRDGTIIVDVGYPKYPEQVKLLPGVIDALKTLQRRGFLIIVVSNQSGIGRGYITSEEAENVHKKFISLLHEADIIIDETCYCPHAPETKCSCRKPLPTMLFNVAEKLNINMQCSFMVGDRNADIETGKKAGCRTILIKGNQKDGSHDVNADCLANNWQDAVEFIIENSQ
jgi:histidinol-phosphate phosphatase family protein